MIPRFAGDVKGTCNVSTTYEVTYTDLDENTETGIVTVYVSDESAPDYIRRLFAPATVHEIARLSDGVIVYLEDEIEMIEDALTFLDYERMALDLRRAESAAYVSIFNAALRAKDRAVEAARSDATNSALSVRAADYGLVPHPARSMCPACPRSSRRLMQAASVLRYRNSHRIFPNTIYGMTAMEEVRRATAQ